MEQRAQLPWPVSFKRGHPAIKVEGGKTFTEAPKMECALL